MNLPREYIDRYVGDDCIPLFRDALRRRYEDVFADLPIPEGCVHLFIRSLIRGVQAARGKHLSPLNATFTKLEWHLRRWYCELAFVVEGIRQAQAGLEEISQALQQVEDETEPIINHENAEVLVRYLTRDLEREQQNMAVAVRNREVAVTCFTAIAHKIMEGRSKFVRATFNFRISDKELPYLAKEWRDEYAALNRTLLAEYKRLDKAPWQPWEYAEDGDDEFEEFNEDGVSLFGDNGDEVADNEVADNMECD